MSPPHPPAPASLRHLPRDRDLAPRLCPLSSVLPASPCPLVTCWSPVVFGTADRVPLRWGSTGTACWLSPRLLARCPRRQPQPSRSLTPGPSAGRLPSVSALPNPLPPPRVPALAQPQLPRQTPPTAASPKSPADPSATWPTFSQHKTGGSLSLFSGQRLSPPCLPDDPAQPPLPLPSGCCPQTWGWAASGSQVRSRPGRFSILSLGLHDV